MCITLFVRYITSENFFNNNLQLNKPLEGRVQERHCLLEYIGISCLAVWISSWCRPTLLNYLKKEHISFGISARSKRRTVLYFICNPIYLLAFLSQTVNKFEELRIMTGNISIRLAFLACVLMSFNVAPAKSDLVYPTTLECLVKHAAGALGYAPSDLAAGISYESVAAVRTIS